MEVPVVAPMEEASSPSIVSVQAPTAGMQWSAVVQSRREPRPVEEAIASRVFGGCDSSKGIAVAVVDASAVIHGDKLVGAADKFVTVPEVLDEVRDPTSRWRLSVLPFSLETMEPSPESIKKVAKFARETGDLQTLSDVDVKLIALTYMLESQIHGTSQLREAPPPLHVVNVRSLQEAEMPGWGSNVPNLAEWEALEQVVEGSLDQGSRILPLKDLDDNAIPVSVSATNSEVHDDEHQPFSRPRKFLAPKKEIKIEGKKMVSDGIDASKGEDTNNVDDWKPAVSRSTHRRYLRRKARRESLQKQEENMDASRTESDDDLSDSSSDHADAPECRNSQEMHSENGACETSELVEGSTAKLNLTADDCNMDLNASGHSQIEKELQIHSAIGEHTETIISDDEFGDADVVAEGNEVDICTTKLDNLELPSQTGECREESVVDDGSSEQSWMLCSLSDSTVACITGDYAMQNVLLQIGLRLLAPGGMQIRQLHRWVLKCHACNNVTQEIGRIFCPKCGNGGTLRKVSVTVGENGVVLAARRQRIILRGTKFSLPMPQGGRDGITKNPILREDQLPHKVLYPKSKKKPTKKDDDFFVPDDIFSQSSDKKSPLQPPVRKALATFSGRRNPNDNHFSHRRH